MGSKEVGRPSMGVEEVMVEVRSTELELVSSRSPFFCSFPADDHLRRLKQSLPCDPALEALGSQSIARSNWLSPPPRKLR